MDGDRQRKTRREISRMRLEADALGSPAADVQEHRQRHQDHRLVDEHRADLRVGEIDPWSRAEGLLEACKNEEAEGADDDDCKLGRRRERPHIATHVPSMPRQAAQPCHASDGSSSPCCRAHAIASSYPASAWRITPVAGSFHSTRSMRRAASGVPSHTITMPACWEKPMPTPPPWWNDTQVAPLAQLRSALSSGQSETASEPSFIASVSRLGLATEPESRWSRPIATGALNSPLATISLNASPSLARSPSPTQQMRAGNPWNLIFCCAMSSQRCKCGLSGISSFTLASVL